VQTDASATLLLGSASQLFLPAAAYRRLPQVTVAYQNSPQLGGRAASDRVPARCTLTPLSLDPCWHPQRAPNAFGIGLFLECQRTHRRALRFGGQARPKTAYLRATAWQACIGTFRTTCCTNYTNCQQEHSN